MYAMPTTPVTQIPPHRQKYFRACRNKTTNCEGCFCHVELHACPGHTPWKSPSSMSTMTTTWSKPRDVDPTETELLKQIVVLKQIMVPTNRTLPFEGLDEPFSVERWRSTTFVMTSPAVSKPIGKEVTSNTSHIAPGSSRHHCSHQWWLSDVLFSRITEHNLNDQQTYSPSTSRRNSGHSWPESTRSP